MTWLVYVGIVMFVVGIILAICAWWAEWKEKHSEDV